MAQKQALQGLNVPLAEYRKRTHEAAQRALAEAEERRRQQAAPKLKRPRELGGPEGPEPTRFGDWERKGIAWDF